MFEIVLNAAQVALSKEARESASSLIEMFRRSPEWQKDICTIDAKISVVDRERVNFLQDLLVDKLGALGFENEACGDYRTCLAELARNAFDHDRGLSSRRTIRIICDTCPTYGAMIVQNSGWKRVALDAWLERAASRLKQNPSGPRGRGLLLVAQLADTMQQDGRKGVKAVVFKDRVRIARLSLAESPLETGMGRTVIVVNHGHSNPSLARRLISELTDLDGHAVIFLSPPAKGRRLRTVEWGEHETTAIGEVVHMAKLKQQQGKDWRIVISSAAMSRLMPKELLATEADLRPILQKVFLAERAKAEIADADLSLESGDEDGLDLYQADE